jgi:hypothetical protein
MLEFPRELAPVTSTSSSSPIVTQNVVAFLGKIPPFLGDGAVDWKSMKACLLSSMDI